MLTDTRGNGPFPGHLTVEEASVTVWEWGGEIGVIRPLEHWGGGVKHNIIRMQAKPRERKE